MLRVTEYLAGVSDLRKLGFQKSRISVASCSLSKCWFSLFRLFRKTCVSFFDEKSSKKLYMISRLLLRMLDLAFVEMTFCLVIL